jgi:hypothetical protein
MEKERGSPRLENWAFYCWFSNPYQAPEAASTGLFGKVYEDPRFDPETNEFADGHRIRTTEVRQLDLKNGLATTRNTTYRLGKIDPDFSKWMEEKGYTLEQYARAINKE